MNDYFSDLGFGDFIDADSQIETVEETQYDESIELESCFTNELLENVTQQETQMMEMQKALQSISQPEPEGNEAVVKSEEVVYSTPTSEAEKEKEIEKIEESRRLIIDSFSWIVQNIKDAVDVIKKTSDTKASVRKYDKVAEMPKITYAKAVTEKSTGARIMRYAIVCLIIGIVFCVMSNSYTAFEASQGNAIPSAMASAFSWILKFDQISVSTVIYPASAASGFFIGFGISAIICLFIWLESDSKKQSRVGHEHGAARLGTNRDFKIFKNKFMER